MRALDASQEAPSVPSQFNMEDKKFEVIALTREDLRKAPQGFIYTLVKSDTQKPVISTRFYKNSVWLGQTIL